MDYENTYTPRLQINSDEKLAKSEPKVNISARPVLGDKTNKSLLSTKVISADSNEFEDHLLVEGLKSVRVRDKSKSEPILHLKSRSRVKVVPNGHEQKVELEKVDRKSTLPPITTELISKLLKHDTFIVEALSDDCRNEPAMFAYLEQEGNLSHRILSLFSRSRGIKSVCMTPSYGVEVDELGLPIEAKYSASKCTKSFYSGYPDLQALDFTNVPVGDEELRFLIKLSKLQALGLSGTKIAVKGIKYLAQYAEFKNTLKCLKLCFVEGINDGVFEHLLAFPKLRDLDLRGCSQVTLNGLLTLVPEGSCHDFASQKKLRLPDSLAAQLAEKHNFYCNLARAKTELITDPKDISIATLSEVQLKQQLKWHRQVYPEIYLNLEGTSLQRKLISILRLRRKEEAIYAAMWKEGN